MLSQKVLKAWIQRIDDNASAKITGNAKDITELTRRIEKLESWMKQYARVEDARLTAYEELEGRLAFLTARHNRITEPAAQERKELAHRIDSLNKRITRETNLLGSGLSKLAGRVGQLERLLEKGAKNND